MMMSSTPAMMAAVSLYVVESGEANPGPLVVLVHGSMDRSGSWVRVVRELRDHHCVRYDRRGYGRSRRLGGGTMVEHVADLFDVLAGRPSVVAGHSYGAAIALAAAERRPDLIRAVVSYEGPMSWRDWWPNGSAGGNAVDQVRSGAAPADAAEHFLRRMIGDERWFALPDRTREERRAEGEALLVELHAARFGDPPYDPARVLVPVISARGTKSDAHLRRGADVLATELPDVELAVVEGADHGAHQSHAAEIAALIRRALARLDSRGP
jgi:pimeloyl-ACP methyl ester carboxylesterase